MLLAPGYGLVREKVFGNNKGSRFNVVKSDLETSLSFTNIM